MPSHGFDWDKNPEVVTQLTELWNSGMSSAMIAKTLGNELTRCAIIGKVHRMGLPSHATGVKGRPPVPAKPKIAAVPKAPPPPSPEKPIPALPPETFGGDRQCKAIEGDPCQPNWQMCGVAVKEGKMYCPYHHSRHIDLVRTAQVRAHSC